MENTETRSALFTVRDAEDALIRFTFILFLILGGIVLHEIILEGRAWLDAVYVMLRSKPQALAWATGLTMSIEGGMIMFSRLQDYRDRRKRRLDKALAEGIAKGKAEGIAEGKAEGIAEGKAEGIARGRAEVYQEFAEVHQEFAAWNARRLVAEARNEPFTEPFPEPPDTEDI